MMARKACNFFPFLSILTTVFLLWPLSLHALAFDPNEWPSFRPLVTKESRRTVASTESGVISAVDIRDGYRGPYHLQFISLEPSSLFLPVLLHTDMVFYVHTGRGSVSWIGEDGTDDMDVERGDIYRLEQGTVFYVQSHPDPTRERLRIHAIFNTISNAYSQESFEGAYSNLSDLVLGFDEKVLQMGFMVSEEVIQGIKWAQKPPPIVHFAPNQTDQSSWKEGIFEALIGGESPISLISGKKKSKKTRTFNILKGKPDVENCNGWSLAVTNKDFRALKGSNIGVFMVNLTKGSMMGPHWNPKATEIAIVTHGQGMVQVVCPSSPWGDDTYKCQNTRFRVKEGDVFVVPRFHPMAQVSFNNDSLVFIGFSTMARNNHPQFLAGKRSVLQTIDRKILAVAFNAQNTTIDRLLASQGESVILECASCAEELEKKMEEEIERQKQEEEAKRRKEEEARKREEEAQRREEEEARKREEEEEARKGEEEEAKRREEEEEARRREEEEEEARKREEEEAKQREQEEEARRREEEEEEARKREEEEAKQREQEEEARRREEEEEAKRREEEQMEREREEEARRREEEDEEAKRREEEQMEREREEEARRREEEEEARRQEDERQRQIEEDARREEEERQRQKEEEEARRQEE